MIDIILPKTDQFPWSVTSSRGETHTSGEADQQDIEGFAYVEINGKTLDFEFIDKNGKVLYSKSLSK